MARRPRTTPEERERNVSEWTASGLSAAAFAESRGIATCTLYAWRRELRAASTTCTFAEVVLRSSDPAGEEDRGATFPIEIAIDDVVVRVGAAFDDSHLRRVLDLLRQVG